MYNIKYLYIHLFSTHLLVWGCLLSIMCSHEDRGKQLHGNCWTAFVFFALVRMEYAQNCGALIAYLFVFCGCIVIALCEGGGITSWHLECLSHLETFHSSTIVTSRCTAHKNKYISKSLRKLTNQVKPRQNPTIVRYEPATSQITC